MSGTSLDGVDGVLVDFFRPPCSLLASAYRPFAPSLRGELLALQRRGEDELHRACVAGVALSDTYAEVVRELLHAQGQAGQVRAIGCHGQTLRHRPELGYTVQLNNPARLAESTGVTVVADFRSRDVAAGGQGAPLVPAFHAALWRDRDESRVVVNLGGMANVTDLPAQGAVRGWDTGPGNVLLDAWCQRHTGSLYDAQGAWGEGGAVDPGLLARMVADPYFAAAPPKSTGRDHFHLEWLARALSGTERPQDVQATLLALTARTIADAVRLQCACAQRVLLCGGGVHNLALVRELRRELAPRDVASVSARGVDPNLVEAMAFAWLARQTMEGLPGNVPAVTGARGERILGAIYPA
jgi:anhydro-N-acetylmuramic acid kinase